MASPIDCRDSFVDKYLIQIDYDIPLNNYNYLGFEDYPLIF